MVLTPRRQGMIHNDELLAALLIQTPLADHDPSHFVLQVADGVEADAAVCGLCDKDRHLRMKFIRFIR